MNQLNLTKLQRCILALLEEAGNENVATLINTATKNSGRKNEVQAIQAALEGLLKYELIEIVKFDEGADQWISCSNEKSVAYLNSLESFLSWSDGKNVWSIQEKATSLEIALTELGIIEASKILEKDGYPRLNSILVSP